MEVENCAEDLTLILFVFFWLGMDAEASLESLCKQSPVLGNLRLSELLTFLSLTQSNAPDWPIVSSEFKQRSHRVTLSGDECRELFTFLRSAAPKAFNLVKNKPEDLAGFFSFFFLSSFSFFSPFFFFCVVLFLFVVHSGAF